MISSLKWSGADPILWLCYFLHACNSSQWMQGEVSSCSQSVHDGTLSGVPCLVPESLLRATEDCQSKFPGGPLILPKAGKTSFTAMSK